MKQILAALICMAIFGLAGPSAAHEGRPLYIEIIEIQPSLFVLRQYNPPTIVAGNSPSITLPEDCARETASDAPGQILYRCSGALQQGSIRTRYPMANPSVSTLIRLQRLSGEQRSTVLPPHENEWSIPRAESATSVIGDFAALGIEHIALGYDHLLFITALMVIAGSLRRLLLVITGFTLAHSITLIASALDVIHIPPPPVEAGIALSIVFVAREVATRSSDSLTWRYPTLISSSFGLLHGLGFASALSEFGLPQTLKVLGLFAFNLGIEIGQIIYVCSLLLLVAAARRIMPAAFRWFAATGWSWERILGYVIGVCASFWLVERIAAF